jgi:hypothetical protein
MTIFLIRMGDKSEHLVLEGSCEEEDFWSSEFLESEITEQLEALAVEVVPADFTEVVDGVLVNIHPLALSARARHILASTYSLGNGIDPPSQMLR